MFSDLNSERARRSASNGHPVDGNFSPQRSKGGEHSITRSDHAADAHREAIGLITQFIPGLAISAYFAINFSSPKTCDERAIALTSCFCSVASFRRRHRLEKNTCVAGRKRLRR